MRAHLDSPDRLLVTADDERDTAAVGQALAWLAGPGDVIALVGTLGAGKTRLSRAIAEALGVDPAVIASPTFVLIHEYESDSLPVYHFDAYRLAGPAAFDALGAAEYWIDGGGLCLIEWADLVGDRLPESAWWIRLEVGFEPMQRSIEIRHADPVRIAQLLTQLNG